MQNSHRFESIHATYRIKAPWDADGYTKVIINLIRIKRKHFFFKRGP